MGIDLDKLITWLSDRGKSRNAVVSAIYLGLAARLKRGDFDKAGR